MTEEQLTEAFRILKDKGVKHFGIHAFLASNTVTNEYYPLLAKILFELAVRVKNAAGVHIAFINLSGGIGIPIPPGPGAQRYPRHRRRGEKGLRGGSGPGRHGRRGYFHRAGPLYAGALRSLSDPGPSTKSIPIRNISAWTPVR